MDVAASKDGGKRLRPVIINSMWRTGSTYLAKQFANSPDYELFYEPAHEACASPALQLRSEAEENERLSTMRHPTFEQPLFANYLQPDPLDGRPLFAKFDPGPSNRLVYEPCEPGSTSPLVPFLAACDRAASAKGRVACFGFCRSGLQHAGWDHAIAGARVIYLQRDPREQFASYGWPGTIYFVSLTIAQLLQSRSLGPVVDEVLPGLLPRAARPILRTLRAGDSLNMQRLGRMVALTLPVERIYALFHLSWLVSNRSGAKSASRVFSITRIAQDRALRESLEGEFSIRFADLRATPATLREGFAYARIEREIEILAERYLGDLLPAAMSRHAVREFEESACS